MEAGTSGDHLVSTDKRQDIGSLIALRAQIPPQVDDFATNYHDPSSQTYPLVVSNTNQVGHLQ
ncbi:hypothetical protein, partial [Haloferax profundi]|uniref:hypothetical protein n=1 Tax=Haloferax profundi TaxID=1544718 RepID=UPI001E52BB55